MATSSGFKVTCPSCEAPVHIRDEGLIGKKTDCPKCKYRFVVEAPAEAPSKKSSAGKAGGGTATAALDKVKSKNKPLPRKEDDDEKPKKKKAEGANPTLMIGGGIGVLAILLLAVGYFAGLFGDSKSGGGSSSSSSSSGSGSSTVAQGGGTTGTTEENPQTPSTTVQTTPEARDITNLLPEDTDFVLAIPDATKFMATPLGSNIFSSQQGAESLFRRCMGFGTGKISKVISAQSHEKYWSFNIFQLRGSVTLSEVKAAMNTKPSPEIIKNREMYLIQENELWKMWYEYNVLLEKEKELPSLMPINPKQKGMPQLAMNLLDDKTVIVADVAKLRKFLEDDASPKYKAAVAPTGPADLETQDPMEGSTEGGTDGTPKPAEGSTPESATPPTPGGLVPAGPPGGGAMGGMYGGGRSGMPGGANANSGGGTQRIYATNSSYRTIDPQIKQMMNALDEKNKAILAVVAKVPKDLFAKMYQNMNVLDKMQSMMNGQPLPPVDAKPVVGVIGLVVHQMDSKKGYAQVAAMFNKDTEAKAVNTVLQLLLPMIAQELNTLMPELTVVPYGAGSQPSSPFGGFPGGEGSGFGAPPPGFGGPPPGYGPPGGFGPPGGGNLPRGGRTNSFNGDQQPPAQNYTLQGRSGPGRPDEEDPDTGGGRGGPPGGFGGMPGFPGGEGGTTPQRVEKPKSYISVSLEDRLVIFDLQLTWDKTKVYDNMITPPVRSFVEGQRGRIAMMGGRNQWWKLATTAQRDYPKAAFPRKLSSDRYGMPYRPSERVSWMTELLPALGYDQLYRRINRDASWTESSNLEAGETWIPEFLNPMAPPDSWRAKLPSMKGRTLGGTNFVGLSGIGLDAAEYPNTPEYAKKLGLFGYDRETKLADVQKGDGLANTIYMIQTPPTFPQPWIAGGGATVRGVPLKNSIQPFISNMSEGKKGTYVVMTDGSVRFISSTISDEAFQSLVTYQGGERVTELDKIAAPIGGSKGVDLRTPSVQEDDTVAGWKELIVPEGPFSVRMPNAAERDEEEDKSAVAYTLDTPEGISFEVRVKQADWADVSRPTRPILEAYVAKMKKEAMAPPPEPKKDADGNEVPPEPKKETTAKPRLIGTTKPIAINNETAITFEIVEEGTVKGYGCVCLAHDKIIQLICDTDEATVTVGRSMAESFFKTFKVLPLEWKEMEVAEGGFKISIPGEPRKISAPEDKLVVYYRGTSDKMAYIVGAGTDESIDTSMGEEALKKFVDSYLEKNKTSISNPNKKDLKIGSLKMIEVIANQVQEGLNYKIELRFALLNDKFVVLQVRNSEKIGANTEKFFKSFVAPGTEEKPEEKTEAKEGDAKEKEGK